MNPEFAGKTIFEFLGTGTSTGMPVPGCSCPVCRSADPHDCRHRSSALVRRGERNVIIDTGPEFRVQCLRAGVRRLDAVLLTHNHADHIAGFDDVRAYSFFRNRTLPVWGSPHTLRSIRDRFAYIWKPIQKGGGLPDVDLRPIEGGFSVAGLRITPVPIMHGILGILGFRIGDLAYMTDISTLPGKSLPLLAGLRTMVISCVRYRAHRTHLSLAGAVRMHELVRPERTLLTHITHHFSHKDLIRRLPLDMAPAYDGMRVEIGGA